MPAQGWLVGEVHDGIAQMFKVIEHARMFVGAKAIATLSAGYQVALDYAKTRVQGADLTATSKDAPRVTITHHPDVRRSLMLQKAYAEGMRALYLYTASFRDQITEAEAAGTADSEQAKLAERVNDLLLPIVKGFGSERATQLLTAESLQTLGGSGYLQDYPIEQYIRDSKIDTLYEGTTAIQGQDFFFRKIVKDGGVALTWLAGQIQATVDGEVGNGRLKEERALLGAALSDVQGMLTAMFGHLAAAQEDMTSLYKVAQNTSRLLLAAGDLITGWLLIRQSEVALAALAGEVSEKDRYFYEGKLAATRFFATQVLPRLSSERADRREHRQRADGGPRGRVLSLRAGQAADHDDDRAPRPTTTWHCPACRPARRGMRRTTSAEPEEHHDRARATGYDDSPDTADTRADTGLAEGQPQGSGPTPRSPPTTRPSATTCRPPGQRRRLSTPRTPRDR